MVPARLTFKFVGLALLLFLGSSCFAFTQPTSLNSKRGSSVQQESRIFSSTESSSSSSSSSDAAAAAAAATTSAPATPAAPKDVEFTRNPDITPTDEWEMDCYSRPVVVNGKKLWEVLVTDSAGSFRYVKTLPSNQVNSKQVRMTMEQFQEDYVDQHNLEMPSIIRFFRGAMFNMLKIALTDLDVISKPSRCTFALAQWLEERHRDVYPKMEGYANSFRSGCR